MYFYEFLKFLPLEKKDKDKIEANNQKKSLYVLSFQLKHFICSFSSLLT